MPWWAAPNVGKSTLFNRIVGERKAIGGGYSRYYKDRLYHDADWNGRDFIIVDTGGIDFQNKDGHIGSRVYQQVMLAIESRRHRHGDRWKNRTYR